MDFMRDYYYFSLIIFSLMRKRSFSEIEISISIIEEEGAKNRDLYKV